MMKAKPREGSRTLNLKRRILMNVKHLLFTAMLCASLPGAAGNPLVTVRAELDRGVLPAGRAQTAVVKLTLDTAPIPRADARPPVNLSIVLDRSGSMHGAPIQHAREAALEAVRRLGPDDIFSLVTYDSTVETLIPAGRLADREEAEQIIRNITPRGMTALFGGVSQGAAELRKHMEMEGAPRVHRMILLSDGLANVGPSSPEELGRLGHSLAKEGISVTTVGLGTTYNEDLMTRLARQSDGNTYYVAHSRDLVRIFNEELGDVLSVAARGVFVRFECPPGVRPVRSMGRDARIEGQTVEIRLNQLYGGQVRHLLLEVELPATPAQADFPVVNALVRYENLLRNAEETGTATVAARFSDAESEVAAGLNPKVMQEVLIYQAAEARNQAVELYERGDRDQAQQLLFLNVQQLQQAGENYDLPLLRDEAENIQMHNTELQRRGLDADLRKSLITEADQTMRQQRAR